MVYDGCTNTRRQYVPIVLTISLTYNIHHGVLCLVRVYALYSLYGRSRRVLGFLLLLGIGSIFTSLVGRSLPTPKLVYAFLNLIY